MDFENFINRTTDVQQIEKDKVETISEARDPEKLQVAWSVFPTKSIKQLKVCSLQLKIAINVKIIQFPF